MKTRRAPDVVSCTEGPRRNNLTNTDWQRKDVRLGRRCLRHERMDWCTGPIAVLAGTTPGTFIFKASYVIVTGSLSAQIGAEGGAAGG